MSVLHEQSKLVWDEIRQRTSTHPMHLRHKYPDVVFDHVAGMEVDVVHAAFWEAAKLGYIKGSVWDDRFNDESDSDTPAEAVLKLERVVVCDTLEQLVADSMAQAGEALS